MIDKVVKTGSFRRVTELCGALISQGKSLQRDSLRVLYRRPFTVSDDMLIAKNVVGWHHSAFGWSKSNNPDHSMLLHWLRENELLFRQVFNGLPYEKRTADYQILIKSFGNPDNISSIMSELHKINGRLNSDIYAEIIRCCEEATAEAIFINLDKLQISTTRSCYEAMMDVYVSSKNTTGALLLYSKMRQSCFLPSGNIYKNIIRCVIIDSSLPTEIASEAFHSAVLQGFARKRIFEEIIELYSSRGEVMPQRVRDAVEKHGTVLKGFTSMQYNSFSDNLK